MQNPYQELDLKCIPFESFDNLNRKWKGDVTFTQQQWNESNVIGVINGASSGGLITIDVDSKKDVTQTLNERVLQAFKITMPEIYDSVYIETTKSKGLHIMYRVEGETPTKTIPASTMVYNTKLNKHRKEALIEVLGEGQQTFIHPSAGYDILGGSLEDLPMLSMAHHDELMKMCKQFNEVPEEEPKVVEVGETKRGRAGDVFNERVKLEEMKKLFIKHGWEIVKEFDGQLWLRRPDKSAGISATWNFEGRKLLMVFSTSTDFTSTNSDGSIAGYTAFQVLTKLEFNGDFKKCASVLKSKGYKDDGAELWHELETASTSSERREILGEKGVEFVMSLDYNAKMDFVSKMNESFGSGTINKKYIDNIQAKRHDEISTQVESGEESWEDELRGDASDIDLMNIFDNDETYSHSFGTNTFANEITIVRPIQGVCTKLNKDGTPLTDRMERLIWEKLAKDYGVSFQSTSISRNLDVLASRNEYHPVQTKLGELKWDGTHRLNDWLRDFCGASDRLEIQMMGRKFLIGAVARIFKRGCKMDNALILKSVEQGMKKSTLPQILSYGYSTDNIGEIGSKDCTQKCQGNWFIELAELDGLKKAKLETIKRWLSSDNDDDVLKYEKRKTKLPRQFVIIGTTNEEKLFSDNEFRRFWAVDVTKIDIEGLLKVRDQLWAEAVEAFQSGENWWFEDESILKSYHDESRERHQHEDEIIKFCEGREFVFTKELYLHIVGVSSTSMLSYTAQRAKEFAPILRRLGYRQNAYCSATKRNGWKRI